MQPSGPTRLESIHAAEIIISSREESQSFTTPGEARRYNPRGGGAAIRLLPDLLFFGWGAPACRRAGQEEEGRDSAAPAREIAFGGRPATVRESAVASRGKRRGTPRENGSAQGELCGGVTRDPPPF